MRDLDIISSVVGLAFLIAAGGTASDILIAAWDNRKARRR